MEPVLQYFQIVNVLAVLIPPVKIQGLDKFLTLNLEPRIRNKLKYNFTTRSMNHMFACIFK